MQNRPFTVDQPASRVLVGKNSFAGGGSGAPPRGSAERPVSFSEAFSSITNAAAPPAAPSASSSQADSTASSAHGHSKIQVSTRQKGNPVLKQIQNVGWEYASIKPDFILGPSACALYISLRYHLLHPEYLSRRIVEVKNGFRLTLIIAQVDLDDNEKPLLEVNTMALYNSCTLLLSWSVAEAAR